MSSADVPLPGTSTVREPATSRRRTGGDGAVTCRNTRADRRHRPGGQRLEDARGAARQVLTEGIEQIVRRGAEREQAFGSITPRIGTAYRENVEPYL